MHKKTGGPAFPLGESLAGLNEKGMTLRDYFAGQVLTGLCGLIPNVSLDDREKFVKRVSFDAYRIADYMLAEREK